MGEGRYKIKNAEKGFVIPQVQDTIYFPKMRQAELPTREQRDSLSKITLVQIIVSGRSGSMLLQSLIDDHPEVIHIPHTFKFYNFIFQHPNILGLKVEEIIDAFLEFPEHKCLFDSSLSVLVGGRLGSDMQANVLIDKTFFKKAFINCMPQNKYAENDIFYAIILAYSWCLGKDINTAKVVLHHVHHGEWLVMDRYLYESINIPSNKRQNGLDILTPSKCLIMLREPYDTFRSIGYFVDKLQLSRREKAEYKEIYYRTLIQDWLRNVLISKRVADSKFLRLEDLKNNLTGSLQQLSHWLEIDPTSPSWNQPTLYGLPWFGDIYTNPTNAPKPFVRLARPSWSMNHIFIWACLGGLPAVYGYFVPLVFKYKIIRRLAAVSVGLLSFLALSKYTSRKDAKKLSTDRTRFVNKILTDEEEAFLQYCKQDTSSNCIGMSQIY